MFFFSLENLVYPIFLSLENEKAYLLRFSGFPHPLVKNFVSRMLRYTASNLLGAIFVTRNSRNTY